MKLNEVEELTIDEYNLMIFTVFNNAILTGFDPSGFKYATPDEQIDDIIFYAEEAKRKGLTL